MPIDAASAVAILSHALGTTKSILDIASKLKNTDLQEKVTELLGELSNQIQVNLELGQSTLDLRQQLIEAREELADVKRKLADNSEFQELKKRLVISDNSYWLQHSDGRDTEGPLCIRCLDADHRIIHKTVHDVVAGYTSWVCPQCDLMARRGRP